MGARHSEGASGDRMVAMLELLYATGLESPSWLAFP